MFLIVTFSLPAHRLVRVHSYTQTHEDKKRCKGTKKKWNIKRKNKKSAKKMRFAT